MIFCLNLSKLLIRSTYYYYLFIVWVEFRDVEILDILQERWLNFVRGTELNPADQKGVAVQGDNINCNGFNSLR